MTEGVMSQSVGAALLRNPLESYLEVWRILIMRL